MKINAQRASANVRNVNPDNIDPNRRPGPQPGRVYTLLVTSEKAGTSASGFQWVRGEGTLIDMETGSKVPGKYNTFLPTFLNAAKDEEEAGRQVANMMQFFLSADKAADDKEAREMVNEVLNGGGVEVNPPYTLRVHCTLKKGAQYPDLRIVTPARAEELLKALEAKAATDSGAQTGATSSGSNSGAGGDASNAAPPEDDVE